MFRDVVGVAIDYTGWLPAHEATLRIRAESVDAIQISTPPGAGRHWLLTDRAQRHSRRCIPHMLRFVDSALPLPPGIPVGVVGVAVKVDGQIDPIARRRDLKFTIA